ncbi:MAG: GNAT family N-acetyltransferase [Saprospiraceae bacterium]|nr:GNAT family N-acetyltransferase [Saprospiraceae bacterium]
MTIEERKAIWREARSPSMKYHHFLGSIPPSVRLTFEPLSYENGMYLYDMFKEDSNPYVDERFKTAEEAEDYLACMLEYACFSQKRAAFDWLIKCQTTNEYIGVFHVHDLSKQVFGGDNLKVTLGYAFSKSFRKKGFANETLQHFSKIIFEKTNKTKLLVYTDKNNKDSIRLMERLSWQRVDEKYVYSEQYAYFELWK